jgi:hypothetical protein
LEADRGSFGSFRILTKFAYDIKNICKERDERRKKEEGRLSLLYSIQFNRVRVR